MRTDLADDPAVISIAENLKIDEDAVIGKLYKVWAWANRQLRSCNADVTLMYVDRLAGYENFGSAMVKVGWLKQTKTGISFPNWDRHNSQSAKQRALTAIRVRNARSVTENGTRPLPEKTRTSNDVDVCRDVGTSTIDVSPNFEKLDWGEVRAIARRDFGGLGMGAKPADRSLVMKTIALGEAGLLPKSWIGDALESCKAKRGKTRKPLPAFFHGCMKTKAAEAKLNFNRLLLQCPEPPEEPND